MIHKLYFQKQGGALKDSVTDWDAVLQSAKLVVGAKVKQPAKRSWYDEDGDDEYIPAVQKVESFDVEYQLLYKGGAGSANAVYSSLTAYLTGSDGTGSVLSVWDDWSKRGWLRCRLIEVCSSGQVYRSWDGDNGGDDDIVPVSVKLRVLSPTDEWLPSGV